MFDVSLQLICTKKSGTLSRIIREINLLGLQYHSHQIEMGRDRASITINAHGDLNCSLESFKALFVELPEVLSIHHVNVNSGGKEVTEFKTIVSETHIAAQERVTPAIELAAEKRLSEILGPVASFIVESTAKDCRNTGELFARLADELNDQSERDYFLSIIEKNK